MRLILMHLGPVHMFPTVLEWGEKTLVKLQGFTDPEAALGSSVPVLENPGKKPEEPHNWDKPLPSPA